MFASCKHGILLYQIENEMQELRIRTGEGLEDNKAFRHFLETLPKTFDTIGQDIHHARNVLKIIDVVDLGLKVNQVMVKRYHGLFWFQKIDYTYFRKPKCRKAFDNTAELRRRGFDAAEELACVEVWNHGLFQYAFFVSAVGEGLRLDSYVYQLQEQNRTDVVSAVIKEYARLVYRLHQQGVHYRDMNCGNALCRYDDETGECHFCLVDTNRTCFYEEGKLLPMDVCMSDLILMNPRMGTVEYFIGEYLKLRGIYSEEKVKEIREIQRKRHEKKRPVKKFLKRYKKQYYKWLEG